MFKIKTDTKIKNYETGENYIEYKDTERETDSTYGIVIARFLSRADAQKHDSILCMELAEKVTKGKDVEINSQEELLIRAVLKEAGLSAEIVGPIFIHMDTQKLKKEPVDKEVEDKKGK